MTDRINDLQLDREIREYLAVHAEDLSTAPTASEMALRLDGRTSRSGVRRLLMSPELRWVPIAALIVLALAGVLIGVGMLVSRADVRTPGTRAYEAVFLRLEEAAPNIDVIVVGVNSVGTERVLAHLPTLAASADYGTDGPNALLGSRAAVSPSGLLALPRTTGNYVFRWEIVDLHRPAAAPITVPGIAQDFDIRPPNVGWPEQRPSAIWGPGDRVAIPMYFRNREQPGPWSVSFADGRTGAGNVVGFPAERFVGFWATDGSGILAEVMSDGDSILPPELKLFKTDGSLASLDAGVVGDGHGRRYRADGTPSGMIEDFIGRYLSGSLRARLALMDIEQGDVAWTADGVGRWLLVPSGPDSHELRLERSYTSGSTTVVALRDEAAPDGSAVVGWFAGAAPDDSMVIVDWQRFKNVQIDTFEIDDLPMEVVVPATNVRFKATGYFAGWLAVP